MRLEYLLFLPVTVSALKAQVTCNTTAKVFKSRITTARWFEHFNASLSIMQHTLWNSGNKAPTLEWIGAFINTLTASSISTFRQAATQTLHPDLRGNTILYYQHRINDYFAEENIAQIYAAAYDDIQWVVLEWLEASQALRSSPEYSLSTATAGFAARASTFYDRIDHEFDTNLCHGGLTWDPKLKPYKNAITNELFLTSSINMWHHLPKCHRKGAVQRSLSTNTTLLTDTSAEKHDTTYLHNALKAYDWLMASGFFDKQGLVVDGFHIADGTSVCNLRDQTVYTYNQGVILSGLRGLWQATSNDKYLHDAFKLIEDTIAATGWSACTANQEWSGLGRGGVLEDGCDSQMKCSQDAAIFKGIYFHHLGQFCKPMIQNVSNSASGTHRTFCAELVPWVEHNAQQALATKDKGGNMGGWWRTESLDDELETFDMLEALAAAHGSSVKRLQPRQLLVPGVLPSNSCRGQAWCQPPGHEHGKRDDEQQRTLETHASGVAVIKAALDFSLWYKVK